MIIENMATEAGDVLYINTSVPIIGLVALTSFTDEVEGQQSANAYFQKSFQYSSNGINWSDWMPLTIENIVAVRPNPSMPFYANYRYERVGSSPEQIGFQSISLIGQIESLEDGPFYKKSIFAENFRSTDINVIGWALNVCEKLYNDGILASYIERGKENGNDEDLIALLYTITTLFAFVVYQTRYITDFSNPKIAREFLNNFNSYYSEFSTSNELKFLMENLWKEFAKRGTSQVFSKEGIKGEFLRLISHQDSYFHYGYLPYYFILGNSSPDCYNIKSYSLDIFNNSWHEFLTQNEGAYLSNFNLNILNINNLNSNIKDINNDYKLLYYYYNTHLHSYYNNNIITYNHNNSNNSEFFDFKRWESFIENSNGISIENIPVSNNQNYLLSFQMKSEGRITIQCSENFNDISTFDLPSVGSQNLDGCFMFNSETGNSEKYLNYRFIIYSSNELNTKDSLVNNVPDSGHLKMRPQTQKINLNWFAESNSSAYICNISLTPLKTKKSKERSLAIFAKNKTKNFTLSQIQEITERELVPLAQSIKLNIL